METIIPPVDKSILEKELTKDLFVRNANNGNNQIFVFVHDQAHNVMRELGRLREMTFSEAGGGTGKSMDIDSYDTSGSPFRQLIVWDPEDKEIVGGYRFILGSDVSMGKDGQPVSATSKLFKFSNQFIKEYWPVTVELGRSFVQPIYQPTINLRKGMYSLDNLWDGLGTIVIDHPEVKYLFGKITMYPDYDTFARDLILYFMKIYFPDDEDLVVPRKPLQLETREKVLKSIFTGVNYDENYRILTQKVRSLKENIPPLVNAYMNLSGSMKVFGTSINPAFGNVEETAIIITIADIYDYKKDRHISSYSKDN